jgi:hypothetical protein
MPCAATGCTKTKDQVLLFEDCIISRSIELSTVCRRAHHLLPVAIALLLVAKRVNMPFGVP